MAEERLQRRLAAILSADVVGYSRLMGIDEAGTLSRLNARDLKEINPNTLMWIISVACRLKTPLTLINLRMACARRA